MDQNLPRAPWATAAGVDIHLELPAGRGRRAALEAALRDAIRAGRITAGEPLPPSRVLAGELGVARGTVVEAYEQLGAEGYLTTRRGSGTFVADAPGLRPQPVHEDRRSQPKFDFRLGRPDLSAFPRRAWNRAVRDGLAEAPDAILGPGDPRGAAPLRQAIAGYIGRVRGVVTAPELIVICSGFIQGLRLLCEALSQRGVNRIALEDPCLPDHRATASVAGLAVTPLPVDAEGGQPATLEPSGADAAVLTPAHQCPLGPTLSASRRREVVRWATEREAIVVEDDYDGEFRYDRQPIGAMQGLNPDAVVYAGTASKTLAPGLRLAWIAVPPGLLEPVVEAKRRADRGTEVIAQLALAKLVDSGGLDRHVRRMRVAYRRRRDAMVQMLTRCGLDFDVVGVASGLHVVALLPDSGPTEEELLELGSRRSVAFNVLGQFWHGPGPHPKGLVIGYAAPPAHAYPEALRELERLLEAATAAP